MAMTKQLENFQKSDKKNKTILQRDSRNSGKLGCRDFVKNAVIGYAIEKPCGLKLTKIAKTSKNTRDVGTFFTKSYEIDQNWPSAN